MKHFSELVKLLCRNKGNRDQEKRKVIVEVRRVLLLRGLHILEHMGRMSIPLPLLLKTICL